ncbi:MAG TPA: hypothetical protein VF185_03150 [Patescibacteria group bacterium]
MSINLPDISIPQSTLIFIIIGAVGFVVLLLMAKWSRMFFEWNFSGAGMGLMVGILLTAAIGGVIILKGGGFLRSIATSESTPDPIKKVLVSSGLVNNVLGTETQKVDDRTVKEDFDSLNSSQKDSVKSYICK